ncbi:UNKNOWN [Stylonychia lemnae]|uniref:Uncharacterized protein n=1 Tax=Stylonychia lemnae TaxID=5949 RepID=A0A078AQB7_STYLE|nr:UNKNOWN [Stylonychia lemnae]|eukprot:CDW84146.1 UNKNOWN [Stylonychia lemnae]
MVFLVQEEIQFKKLSIKSSKNQFHQSTSKHKKALSDLTNLVRPHSSRIQENLSKRYYIGDYLCIQYLEDCGILDRILTGEQCPHFRVYKGKPYFQLSKVQNRISGSVLECNQCTFEKQELLDQRFAQKCSDHNLLNLNLLILCNYFNSYCKLSHELCSFFENSNINFRLIDPMQSGKSQLLSNSTHHILINQCKNASKEELPMIFIHGQHVDIQRVLAIAQKGTFLSIIGKSRCLHCEKKINSSTSHQKIQASKQPLHDFCCQTCHIDICKTQINLENYFQRKPIMQLAEELPQQGNQIMYQQTFKKSKSPRATQTKKLAKPTQMRQSICATSNNSLMLREDVRKSMNLTFR